MRFFAVATAIGSYFGAKFTLLPLFRIPVKMTKVSAASPLTQKPDQARRRFRLGMLVFCHGCLGDLHGDESAKTWPGHAVRRRFWSAD